MGRWKSELRSSKGSAVLTENEVSTKVRKLRNYSVKTEVNLLPVEKGSKKHCHLSFCAPIPLGQNFCHTRLHVCVLGLRTGCGLLIFVFSVLSTVLVTRHKLSKCLEVF